MHKIYGSDSDESPKSDSSNSDNEDLGSDSDCDIEERKKNLQAYIERHYKYIEGVGYDTPPDSDSDSEKKSIKDAVCNHYQNRCYIVAPCCKKVFACWKCHNQQEDHVVNKHEIKEIVCKQ
jgi:hypothetical protein